MIYVSNTKNGGIVKILIIIISVLILLAYLGFNLRGIIKSPTFIDNWNIIKDVTVNIWTNYLAAPISYLFNKIFIPMIWQPIVNMISGGVK